MIPLQDNPLGTKTLENRNKQTLQEVEAEARRGCLLYEREVSKMLSSRCIAWTQGLFGIPICTRSEYLFACGETVDKKN